MQIKVTFQVFSKLKELCNQSNICIEIENGKTIQDCFNHIIKNYPQITLEMLNRCRVAQHNKYITSLNNPIVEDSTYLLISPISGG